MENWKDIENLKGYYQVSDLGRVRSNFLLNGKPAKSGEYMVMNAKISFGYVIVTLALKHINGGKSKEFRVHRLVAKAFIENPENKPEVNHKDGIKTNNFKSNLEWNTSQENNIHAFKTGLRKPNKIQISNMQKLGAEKTKKKVINTETNEVFNSVKELAIFINVKSRTLANKLTGHRKNNTNYKYL